MPDSRILITGASGFIGSRLCEKFSLHYGLTYRAMVRTFGKAVFGVSVVGPHNAKMFVDTPYIEDQTQVSSDRKLIAYNSDESGRWEVYVATFPGFTQKRQVSLAGDMDATALARRDGKELFYLAADGTMMAADITGNAPPMSGMPRPLFQTRLSPSPNVPQYDVTADGSKFLVIEPAGTGGEPITLVLNRPPPEVLPVKLQD
jgi:hypothetical protein